MEPIQLVFRASPDSNAFNKNALMVKGRNEEGALVIWKTVASCVFLLATVGCNCQIASLLFLANTLLLKDTVSKRALLLMTAVAAESAPCQLLVYKYVRASIA